MTQTIHQNIIIGSGPAGLTAAIYMARADFNPVLIEGPQPGGQLTITTDVENYPGFPDGIFGQNLMDDMRKQAEKFNTEIITANVINVELNRKPFEITYEDMMANTKTILTNSLIIATGATARLLGLPEEEDLMGYGLSACATCDGAFYKNKNIAIVGGGDTAMEEALFLTRFAQTVTVIHRREGFRASEIMLKKARENPKIKWHLNQVVNKYIGTKETGITALQLKNTKTGELTEFKTDGLFLAIGHTPNTELFKNTLELDENNYIITQPGSTKTNIPGVFAAGDVSDSKYRQAVTAAGFGCMAAIDAKNFLD